MTIFLALVSCTTEDKESTSSRLIIENVAVIDVVNGSVNSGLTVVIENNRISSIQSVSDKTDNDTVIDGSGKFLIPGLWDMHTHRIHMQQLQLLFLANGITGVRDLGSEAEKTLALRNDVNNGERLGPRIFSTGHMVDGPKDYPWRITVESPEEGRAAVLKLKEMGVDFIKTHNGMTRETFFAVVDEAEKNGLPVAAHLSPQVSLTEASDAGVDSIEHVVESQGSVLPSEALASLTVFKEELTRFVDQRAADVFTQLAKNGTAFCPTSYAGWLWASEFDPEKDISRNPDFMYIPDEIKQEWEEFNPFPGVEEVPEWIIEGRKFQHRKSLEIIKKAFDAGVLILAGTDAPARFIVPGFSMHEELAVLVDAGLTPLQALQTATLNPAQFMGKEDDHGTIEVGKIADLVLLSANPLENIRNTRHIEAIIFNGTYLPRVEFDEMLFRTVDRESDEK